MSVCYLKDFPGECWPRIDRAHWVPKRLIKQAFCYGAMENQAGRIVPQARIEEFCMGGEPWHEVPVDVVIWDPRVYSPICRFHHGQLDSGAISVSRGFVPVSVKSFCEEHGLLWYFDRAYPIEESYGSVAV